MVVHKCHDKTTLPVCKCNSVSCSYRKICYKKGIKWLSSLNYLTWLSHCLNNAVSDRTFFSASVWNLILSSVWTLQAERLCKLWVDTSAFYYLCSIKHNYILIINFRRSIYQCKSLQTHRIISLSVWSISWSSFHLTSLRTLDCWLQFWKVLHGISNKKKKNLLCYFVWQKVPRDKLMNHVYLMDIVYYAQDTFCYSQEPYQVMHKGRE